MSKNIARVLNNGKTISLNGVEYNTNQKMDLSRVPFTHVMALLHPHRCSYRVRCHQVLDEGYYFEITPVKYGAAITRPGHRKRAECDYEWFLKMLWSQQEITIEHAFSEEN